MAPCNLLILALFGTLIVTFGPSETTGAPIRLGRGADPCADFENDTTAVMKNGLSVMYEVSVSRIQTCMMIVQLYS